MNHDNIAILVKIASLEFDKLSNQILAEYDLTSSQFKVMKYLLKEKERPVRQIDIERFFCMKNPSVTGLLHNLEKKQWIERVPNPKDHRSKVIKLTQKAYKAEGELTQLGKRLEEEFTQRLDEKEREQLKDSLKKLLGR